MIKRLSLLTTALAAGLMLMTDLGIAAGESTSSPAENTERNVRDRNDAATVTPDEQSQDQRDIDLLAAVRKAITDDDSLSVNAHNIKIITRNGKITLRGPVDSAAEKTKVHEIVHKITGVTNVDNQLEVK